MITATDTITTTTTTGHDTTAAAGDAEHVLAVVEPTTGGSAALDVAHDVVARGGRASVVVLITDRVAADIRDYAAAEELSSHEAEAAAIEQFTAQCRDRIGADVPTIVERHGWLGTDIRRHISSEITTVAVPEGLVGRRGLDKIASRLGRRVVVTPSNAA